MNEVERLKFLRKRAKIGSAKKAAEFYGIGYDSYKKLENATDPHKLTAEQARKIARWHRISSGWVMFGEGKIDGDSEVRLEGSIGAGQEMILFEDATGYDTIDVSLASDESRAFEASGDSMLPLARNGDIVVVGPPTTSLKKLIGEECAVQLQDGRRFFKVLANGSKQGTFDLISYNAEPMRNMEVHSAGTLRGIIRRGQAGKQIKRRAQKS